MARAATPQPCHEVMSGEEVPSCPFCPFAVPSTHDEDITTLLQHLDTAHPEQENQSSSAAFENNPQRSRSRSRSAVRGTFLGVDAGKLEDASQDRSSRREWDRSRTRSRSRTPLAAEDDFYVDCPANCGEAIHMRELQDHLDLHEEEDLGAGMSGLQVTDVAMEEQSTPEGPDDDQTAMSAMMPAPAHSLNSSRTRHRERSLNGIKSLFLGPAPRKTRTARKASRASSTRRLGKAELGPYAYEEKMPSWLYKQLERGGRVRVEQRLDSQGQLVEVQRVDNEDVGVTSVLAHLCEQDRHVSKAFLCHPAVKHVYKLPREGGFCGYRNIQMLVSFLQATRLHGHEYFPGPTPSIPHLQDLIETAWDRGFNSSGRIETGGIRGTRKYIGTPEAQALFCSLEISCEASAFNRSHVRDRDRTHVHDSLLEAVLGYFSSGVTDPSQKVYRTQMAPIYFQHPGHSLTIVGLEVRKSGSMNLLVFDPMFKTAPGTARLIDTRFTSRNPERLLKAYRRGNSYLSKYHSFELLKFTGKSSTGDAPGQARIMHGVENNLPPA